MSVRAKFRCNYIEEHKAGVWNQETQTSVNVPVKTIHFSPVFTGSEENKQFWAATPAGDLRLMSANEAASAQFEVGKEYYLDFTPAE
jgi:hypothetical protein